MRPIDADALKVTKIVECKRKVFADGKVRKVNDWTEVVLLDDIKNAPTIEPYGRWIPCSQELPEEKINPITQDYYEYQVTAVFANEKCIRCYKFGNGHWWHGGLILDERVLAWMPLLEPYREEKK